MCDCCQKHKASVTVGCTQFCGKCALELHPQHPDIVKR